jgi:hypothetical protein
MILQIKEICDMKRAMRKSLAPLIFDSQTGEY